MTDLNAIPYRPAAHQAGGIQSAKAEIIVIHDMECPAEDRRVTGWVAALGTPAGSKFYAHYYTGPGVTYRVAPLGRVVPHVGNGNMVRGIWTCGIEQAGYAAWTRQQWIDSGALNTSRPLLDALIADGHGARVWLTPEQLKKPGVRGVTSHNNMRIAFGGTTHTDPGPNYPVDLLLAGTPVPPPKPPPTTEDEEDMTPVLVHDPKTDQVWIVRGQIAVPVRTPDDLATAKFLGAVDKTADDGTAVLRLCGKLDPAI